MSKALLSSRRLLIGSVLLSLFVLLDLGLFGWLIFRSLSEREISRVLGETRSEAETLAKQLASRAREQGQDLYLAVATERETQTYIDSVLRQRDMVRNLEIRDRENRLVYQMQTRETVPVDPAAPTVGSPEIAPHYEEKVREKQQTYDVYDLTVPIADLGQIRVGISREELERRVQVLRGELIRQASVVGVVTLALLVTGSAVIFALFRRSRVLEAKAAEAEQLATIGTLAAGLAHEIRNPLNSLSLNMQMLEEDLLGDPRLGTRRVLAITRGEIGRLERLVTDFLAYARPRPLERRRMLASSLLEHARDLLAGQAAAERVQLRVENDAPGAWLEVDAQQLSQLLLNLTQNAFFACEQRGFGGKVVLRARREAGQVALEVEDNGVGIAEEDRERVFEVFYSTRKGGTGLGLAIARRIATSHGGEIEVAGARDEGTIMRLWLPEAEAAAEEATERAAATAPATGQPLAS
ncbi:MAG TPA: ATP-binding protein [Thermoanaerobaculia bacterium]|nr:ATP-binding protein [Thermoanaerobaculia bacterium]